MRSHLFFAVLLLGAIDCSSNDQTPLDAGIEAGPSIDEPVIPDKYAAFANAFDVERQKLNAPGASVAIVEHGQLTFAHGFGTKGPNSTDSVKASTLFRIGSMTKALTATALLQQVHAGKVDLQAKAKDLLPDLAIPGNDLANVTVAELITHQTGLYDYLAISGGTATSDDALQSYLASTTYSSNEYFMDPPGSMWNYANPNFYIAGAIAEKASGSYYRDDVTQNVLAPLGMSRTFFLASDVLADGDYSNGASVDQNNQPWDVAPNTYENVWARPAGYAFSNALDYAKFAQFLMQGNDAVLASDLLAAMQSPQVDTKELGDIEHYGYALFVDDGIFLGSSDYRAVKIVTHGGAIPGFATEFWMVPSTGFAIVTCANTDGAYFRNALAVALQSFGDLPPTGAPPNLAVDPSTLDSIAGNYSDAHNVGAVTITNQNGTLMISMPDLDMAKVPYTPKLSPSSPDTFILTVQGMQLPVTFIRNAQGNVTFMRTRIFVAGRVQPGVIPPHAARPLDRATILQAIRTIGPAPVHFN